MRRTKGRTKSRWKRADYMKPGNSMRLKTRIMIAFLAIILIPVTLTGVAFYGLMHYKVRAIGKAYGIENPTYESIYNNSLMISKMMDEEFQSIKQQIKETPELLEDNAYLNQLNEALDQDYSYLAVRKDDRIYYNGSTTVSDNELLEELPQYGESYASSDTGMYIRTKEQSLVKQIDFLFQDGSKGSLFLITRMNQMFSELRSWMLDMVVIVILILIITSLVMSLWIYRGVVTPLNQLKKATQNIRDGNLDFTVEGNGVQEVNDLCEDFEEMRKRLKESAEEKIDFDKDNKELISNISHDLKTPITAVKGYVEGIMDGVADTPEKMERYIRTIYNKANEMDRLINELTFYSKIDTNRIPYTFTKIHISDYFEDCVEELSLELESKHIELAYFNYMVDDAVVIADAEQLKRVINNIVGNSIKYIDKPRGLVNIRLRDVGDFIQVEIEDNGKGIAQKDLPRIFDRFYRTDASRNSTRGGSGIGLSIVRKILEDHGGKVWATSKEGVGTVMYFVLRKYQEVPVDEQDTNNRR